MFEKSKLHDAIRKNDIARVEEVLQKKPELLYAMMVNHEASPLSMALQLGHAEMIEFLVQKDPELKSRSQGGANILFDAFNYGRIDFLKKHGIARPDLLRARNYRNASLLHMVAEKNDTQTAEWLLEQGLDIEALTSSGRTPLQQAEYYSNERMVAFLRPYAVQAELRHKQTAQRMVHQSQGGERWRLLDDNRIAHVSTDTEIGYRITAIFNFATSERTRVYRNMETDQESVETTVFDTHALAPYVREAQEQFVAKGGKILVTPAARIILKRP